MYKKINKLDNFENEEIPMLSVIIKYTKEEYMKFNKFSVYVLLRYLHISLYFLMLLAFAISLYLTSKFTFSAVLSIVGVIVYTIVIIAIPYIYVWYNIKKKKIKKGLNVEYQFYNDYFKVRTKDDAEFINKKYTELYSVYESKDNFYLYINKSSAYIVSKKKIAGSIYNLRKLFISNLGKKFRRLI